MAWHHASRISELAKLKSNAKFYSASFSVSRCALHSFPFPFPSRPLAWLGLEPWSERREVTRRPFARVSASACPASPAYFMLSLSLSPSTFVPVTSAPGVGRGPWRLAGAGAGWMTDGPDVKKVLSCRVAQKTKPIQKKEEVRTASESSRLVG